jgi:hypothetical protein
MMTKELGYGVVLFFALVYIFTYLTSTNAIPALARLIH